MCMCVLNIRHFSIPSAPLCWLSFRQQSCCWHLLWKQPPSYERDVLHPSLPHSSLSSGHIGPDLFLLCVCVCPIQRRLPLPTQWLAWGCTRDAGFAEGTGKLPNSLAKWTTTLKELCDPGSSLFPSVSSLFPSVSRCCCLTWLLFGQDRECLRETVFVFQKEMLTSVLVGGCKYNIISRSLWLLPEIIHIYICAGTSAAVSRSGSHCLTAPWLLEISIVARKINFHSLKVTTEPLCKPFFLCGEPSSLPHREK